MYCPRLKAAVAVLVFSRASSSAGPAKAAGLKVTFKVTGVERRLPPALETALFRVVQETFNNIVRHAQARKVTARVDFRKDSFQIRIKDDGSGFDVAQAMSSTDKMRGMGLVGMRERVELVQGTINVKSSPDHGTEVTVVVPLGEETGNG